ATLLNPAPPPLPPQPTNPLIQNIIDGNLKKLKKQIRDKAINGLYHCAEWKDIGANPNQPSYNLWTPLDYALMSKAPVNTVRGLNVAKAKLNAIGPFGLTPLDIAVKDDREDIVRILIHAGALVQIRPLIQPNDEHIHTNLVKIIHHLAPNNILFSKIQPFVDFQLRILQQKSPTEIFDCFDKHLLEENPQKAFTMIDLCFDNAEYRQTSIKWLRGSN
ncbi:unnamed protein product, partial [Coregonus sp. 'balchen']